MTQLISRRSLATSAGAALALTSMPLRRAAAAATVSGPNGNNGWPLYPSLLPTGCTSHWLQPWRTMIGTLPFQTLQNSLGIQNSAAGNLPSLQMFANAGFRHVRVGVPFASVLYDDPTTMDASDLGATTEFLQAAQAAGLRPLILLQAFDQNRLPRVWTSFGLTVAASPGDMTLTLASTEGLTPNYSGPTGYVENGAPTLTGGYVDPAAEKMCPVFFTRFDGNVATLSQPLGVFFNDCYTLLIYTLRYKPWANYGSDDYNATMAGWCQYVCAMSRYVSGVLGTTGASDLGFDVEIWNELTFGSDFLDINNYYTPAIVPQTSGEFGFPEIVLDLVTQTAATMQANPALFAGVRASDGMANVEPWQASSTEPVGITALSKHTYPTVLTFPADDAANGDDLDSTYNFTSFVPTYTLFVPEAVGTALTSSITRDVTTETVAWGGVNHGQDARTVNGTVLPVSVWVTETGIDSSEYRVTDTAAIYTLATKGTLRTLFFNAALGIERTYIFCGVGDITYFALVDQNNPTVETLPILALQRAMTFISGGAAPADAGTLLSWNMTASVNGGAATLFQGNGTASCPDFVQPDDFIIVPIQVSATRTAFVYWFHALDIRNGMSDLSVSIIQPLLAEFGAGISSVACYDPVNDVQLAWTGEIVGSDIVVTVPANDTPRILLLEFG